MSPTPVANLTTRRNEVRNGILSCTGCGRAEERPAAPIPFTGPAPSPFMMVGDVPTEFEGKHGGLGMAGENMILAKIFAEVGLPRPSEWFRTHALPCYSPDAPTPAEWSLCSHHMSAMVKLANPDYIVTFGAEALNATRLVKDKIGKVHGRLIWIPAGPMKDHYVFPTFHPGSIFRDAKKQTEIAADLSTLASLWRGTMNPSSITLRVGAKGKTKQSTA